MITIICELYSFSASTSQMLPNFFFKCMQYKYNFNIIADTADFTFDFYIFRFTKFSVTKVLLHM